MRISRVFSKWPMEIMPFLRAAANTGIFHTPSPSNRWLIDCGATDHMTNSPQLFSSFSPFTSPTFISLADGSRVPAIRKGTVPLSSDLILMYVLLVPSFPMSLLSVTKLCSNNLCQVVSTSTCYSFQDTRRKTEIWCGFIDGRLFLCTGHPDSSKVALTSSSSAFDWHVRLGHPNLNKLKLLVPSLQQVSQLWCESCQLSKHSRVSFPLHAESKSTCLFEVVHSDVWGPLHAPKNGHFKYYVVFIDDYSCITYLYLMKERSEVVSKFVFSKFIGSY